MIYIKRRSGFFISRACVYITKTFHHKNMLMCVIIFSAQSPRNCPADIWSLPTYHGHAWVPWIQIPPGVTDYRACPPEMADAVTDEYVNVWRINYKFWQLYFVGQYIEVYMCMVLCLWWCYWHDQFSCPFVVQFILAEQTIITGS